MKYFIIASVFFITIFAEQSPLPFGPTDAQDQSEVVRTNVRAVAANISDVNVKLESLLLNTSLSRDDQQVQVERLAETFPREVRALLFIARHYRPENTASIFGPETSSYLPANLVQKNIVIENVRAVVANVSTVYGQLESILVNVNLSQQDQKVQIQRLAETFPREIRALYFIARHYRPEDTTPVFAVENGEKLDDWRALFGNLDVEKNSEKGNGELKL